jgi:formyl-CoA transferase
MSASDTSAPGSAERGNAHGAGPLAGLRVIDAASFLAGPCAATLMSDFGADVIKVESVHGDGHRTLSGSHHIDYTWQLTNRNKRGLALDFTTAVGREVLLRLVDDADVLLLNLRADQVARYGLDWPTLQARNGRLVYAQVSGYGLEGAESGRRAFDATAWFARGGVLDVMHDKDAPPPQPAGGVGDHATAMTLFGAIMMALFRRERTGEGGMVSTSLAGMGAWANGLQLQGLLAGFDPMARRDEEGFTNPFNRIYATGDGRHLMLALSQLAQEWPRLARALGHPEWIADPRFADVRTIMRNRFALRGLITDALGTMTLAEADAALTAHDCNFGVVSRLRDVVEDPQLLANGAIVATDEQVPGYDRALAAPIRFEGVQQRVPSRAPMLGEHSRAVLAEFGYSPSAVDALVADGIVRVPR